MDSSTGQRTKAILRSSSKPKATGTVVDHVMFIEGSALPHDSKYFIDQQVEKSYRDHGLKTLAQRHSTSDLEQLGGVAGVAHLLATDLRTGLGETDEENKDLALEQLKGELELRRNLLGTNYVSFPKQSLLWKIFITSFLSDPVDILSAFCIIIFIVLGSVDVELDRTLGLTLLVIQFLLCGIDVWSALRLAQLLDEDAGKNMQVKAIRCGRKGLVLACELVVGDLVELRTGDRIPADGLLVEGHKLEISTEGATTCLLNPRFLISGSVVHSGSGLMLVTAVGEGFSWPPRESETGKQSALLHLLEMLNAILLRLKLSISLLYMLILIPFYFSGNYNSDPSGYFVWGQTRAVVAIYNLVYQFYNSLAFVVIVIPDTVTCAVKLSLVSFLQRMTGKGASIRNLETCELKLGFVTTVCMGKKNVLTLDEMDVHSCWVAGHPCDQILPAHLPEDIWELLSEGVALNTTGYYKHTDSKTLENSCESAVEKALLRWGQDVGLNIDSVRQKCTTLKMEFFESERMQSGVALRRDSDGKCVVHWKGAAEIMLSSCSSTWLHTAEGRVEIETLSEQQRSNFEGIVASMGEDGLSCVALAYCEGVLGEYICMGGAGGGAAGANMLEDGSRPSTSVPLPENELTLLALVGMKQKMRPEAKEAVKKAKDAGIRVIMVTGDSLLAARAIAKDSGIIEECDDIDDKVVDASTFDAWDVNERPEKLEKIAVIARASGSQKLQLVLNLQAYGRKEVVALTGYKCTDVPALKKADVGFSLNCGVQVAKESSDVILLDDSFASVYKAIEWARSMRYNIQHFLHFQVTLSLATALIAGLTTMQFQWIHLMTTLATIALTMQPPLCSLMSQRPAVPPMDEPLFTYPMWRNVALQAAYQVILCGWMIYSVRINEKLRSTISFNTFIFCQVINMVNARQSLLQKDFIFHTGHGIKVMVQSLVKNELLLWAMIAVIGIAQVGLIMFLGSLLSTVRLNWAQWLVCVGLALPSWFIAVLGKWLKIPATPTASIFST